jgi:hypothetical protein
MRLTYKDGIMVVLMTACTTVLLAVTQGWDWPLLGSYRTGTLALGILGLGMCAGGARYVTTLEDIRRYFGVMSVAGGSALILVVVGLVTGWQAAFVALWAVILAKLLVTTVRHAIVPEENARPATAKR